ncbi:AAA family ATPase [Patescibacteria group bacterium]|nr:AAA family ATPase [Patescibacteria group bacterium]
MLIIGITGTLGSGKGTVAEYLVEQKGFKSFSIRDYLSEILKGGNKKINRNSLVDLGNILRSKFGSSYLAEQLYKKAEITDANSIIESLRNPGEIKSLRKKGNFYLFATDADSQIRYERIKKRKSKTDKISFKEFIANEKREMTSDDPDKQNLSACVAMADYVFVNDGTFENLYNQIEEALGEIEKKR